MAFQLLFLKRLNMLVTQTKIFTDEIKKQKEKKRNTQTPALGHTDDGRGRRGNPCACLPTAQTLTVVIRVELSLQLLHFPLVS